MEDTINRILNNAYDLEVIHHWHSIQCHSPDQITCLWLCFHFLESMEEPVVTQQYLVIELTKLNSLTVKIPKTSSPQTQ